MEVSQLILVSKNMGKTKKNLLTKVEILYRVRKDSKNLLKGGKER